MNTARTKIIIAFRHLGPYHYARISALAKNTDFETIALELSGKAEDHFQANKTETFRTIHLFPDSDILKASAASVHKEIYNALSVEKPDMVIVPGWGTRHSLVMLCWCLDNNVPSVLMSDSIETAQQRFGAKEFFKKSIVQMFNSVLVAGTPHAEYVKKLGMPECRIFFGFDVVDNNHFQKGSMLVREDSESVRSQLDLPKKYFLAVSRFVHVKNIARILKAYALYKKEAKSNAWDLVVVGDGEESETLQEICRLLPELSSGVHFVGSTNYEKLPFYYALASAFILASVSETWGLVVNEAMASGLPIILSNKCGCTAELLEDGKNGFTFDPYDENDIAKAMSKISSENIDIKKMGQISLEIISKWDLDRFTAGIKKAISVALNNEPVKRGFPAYLLLRFFTKF